MLNNFSDYIIYADESGDHSLVKVNLKYPVFCLTLCVIKKEDYINKIVPAVQKLKFDYWGHDKIVLHEADIKKNKNDFNFFHNATEIKNNFICDIDNIVRDMPFYVISAVIDKRNFQNQDTQFTNPYDIALKFCMENLMTFLTMHGQLGKKVHCIFEGRGDKENRELKDTFNAITNSDREINFKAISYELKFVKKEHNSTGVQLADLMARPIGRAYLDPQQLNRSYEIIKCKYYVSSHKVFL